VDLTHTPRLLAKYLTPEQAREFTLFMRHVLAWWSAQGVGGQVILGLVFFALLGVMFTFVRAFFTKMPPADKHAVAQERVNEEMRRRQRSVRQARF
jgi:hypothetical protein